MKDQIGDSKKQSEPAKPKQPIQT